MALVTIRADDIVRGDVLFGMWTVYAVKTCDHIVLVDIWHRRARSSVWKTETFNEYDRVKVSRRMGDRPREL